MKTMLRWLVLVGLLSLPWSLHAAGEVMRYWPMNHGDIKYFNGPVGLSYLQISQSQGSSSRFLAPVLATGGVSARGPRLASQFADGREGRNRGRDNGSR